MKTTKIAHILHSVGGVDVSLRLILENIDNTKFENIVVHGQNDSKDDFFEKFKKTHTKEFDAVIDTVKKIMKEKQERPKKDYTKSPPIDKKTKKYTKKIDETTSDGPSIDGPSIDGPSITTPKKTKKAPATKKAKK
jgi:hypothetical protein